MTERERFLLHAALYAWRLKLWIRYTTFNWREAVARHNTFTNWSCCD